MIALGVVLWLRHWLRIRKQVRALPAIPEADDVRH